MRKVDIMAEETVLIFWCHNCDAVIRSDEQHEHDPEDLEWMNLIEW